MTDPLEKVWKYEYNTAGDKTAETDPESDKRTWGYNADSQETEHGQPPRPRQSRRRSQIHDHDRTRRHRAGEQDHGPAQTRNELHIRRRRQPRNQDRPRTATKRPTATTPTTSGPKPKNRTKRSPKQTTTVPARSTSQTDGNKHTTKYERNVLEQVSEVIDPLSRKTTKEYDAAGNLISVTDATKRTTPTNTTTTTVHRSQLLGRQNADRQIRIQR